MVECAPLLNAFCLQIYRQSKAFIAGMTDVISLDWFRLFDAEELQVLISGADADIDVEDLRNNTKYVGGMFSGDSALLPLCFRSHPPSPAYMNNLL